MTRTDAIEKVLAFADTERKNKVEEVPRGSNRGPRIKQYLAITGLDEGYSWCAAFVAFCGRMAIGSAYPMPLTADCDVLLRFAKKNSILHETDPKRGDIFLLLTSPGSSDAHHTGFMTGSTGTTEGNTNDDGSREGYGVFARTRTDTGSLVFARWADILPDVTEAAPWKLYKDTVSPATYIGECGTDTDGSATYPVRLLLYALKGTAETTVNLSYNPVANRLTWGDVTIPVNATDRDGTKIVPVRSVAVWAGYDVHADAVGRTITLKKKVI